MKVFGVSNFTFLTILLCGAGIRLVLFWDLQFEVKAFSVLLLFLVALMVFSYDSEMEVLESMKK
jgi:hypothetical protein